MGDNRKRRKSPGEKQLQVAEAPYHSLLIRTNTVSSGYGTNDTSDTIREKMNKNKNITRIQSGYGRGGLALPPSVSYLPFPIGGYGDTA